MEVEYDRIPNILRRYSIEENPVLEFVQNTSINIIQPKQIDFSTEHIVNPFTLETFLKFSIQEKNE